MLLCKYLYFERYVPPNAKFRLLSQLIYIVKCLKRNQNSEFYALEARKLYCCRPAVYSLEYKHKHLLGIQLRTQYTSHTLHNVHLD